MDSSKLPLALPHAAMQMADSHPVPMADAVARALRSLAPGRSLIATMEALAPHVEGGSAHWPPQAPPQGGPAPSAPAPLTDQQREFDAYFRIMRTTEVEPARVFCAALTQSYYRFLKEATKGNSLSPAELGMLCAALEGLLSRFAADKSATCWSSSRDAEQQAADVEPSMLEPPEIDPIERWICGHHVFFVLVQGLLAAHTWFARALSDGRRHEAVENLALTTDLWWAAAAAFRFAGDFPRAAYIEIVRPSMAPPHVSEGFSGLAFAEHRLLITLLQSLRPQLEALPTELHAQRERYMWAFNTMYESHAYVCAHFVEEGASLRGRAVRRQPNAAAAIVRGHLKRRVFGTE